MEKRDFVLTEGGAKRSQFWLPSWVPAEAWNAYEEMRRKIKKPMTRYAKVIAVKKLNRLREEGYDPRDVLEQSIFNCWQGLFPIGGHIAEDENQNAVKRTFTKRTA